jgi:predicted MFS family arabinose efflux permease
VPIPSRNGARRIAVARLISLTGTEAAFTALLFVLFQRTGSSRWIAAALLLTFGAEGFLSPLAGALGDRIDRRRLMIASDLLGAACFSVLALAGSPSLLLGLAFAATVAASPFFPAAGAAVPNLVSEADLAWANGTIAFGSNVGYMVGPALGGALVAWLGAPTVFVLNALSFLFSAGLVWTVRGSFSADRDGEEGHHGMRAGFVFILHDPVLRTMIQAFAVVAISVGSVLVAELPLVTSFHGGSLGFGLLATSFGVGALAGSLLGKRLTKETEHRALVIGSFVTAVGFGSVILIPALAPVFAAMVVAGGADGVVEVAVEVIFQRRSPDRVRSRVIAALEAVFHIGLALSFLFAGSLVDVFGPKAAYALAGTGCTVAAIMLLPVLREREQDSASAGP